MRERIGSMAALVLWVGVVGCSGSGASVLQYRPVDEGARSAALTSIKTRADELAASGKERAAQNQELAEHARTLADVAFATPSVDGVVGLFYDGQPFIILNNVLLAEVGSSSSPLRQPDEREGYSLPGGKAARLMNGFPKDFPADPSGTLSAILSKKGYAPVPSGASVEDFKKVAGDAVLHIRTHGGGGEVLDKDGKPVQEVDASGKAKEVDGKPVYAQLFGLWTTDLADSATLAKYSADLAGQRLVRMYEVVSPCLWDWCSKKDWHLGITLEFVKQYWGNLALGAYVHVSACSTAGPARGNQAFVDTILNKTTGAVYVGWNQPAVVAEMDRAATFLIDRLAGANVLDTGEDPKEDPPQRPFDLQSVLDQMGNRKMLTSSGAGLTVIPDTGVALDEFVLAPSIQTLEPWDYDENLLLKGLFGSDKTKATITVGGSPCAVDQWSSTQVTCKLDKAAKGEVVVTVDGHESNKVKLGSWKGKLTYAIESKQPGLSQLWTIDLHLRGDLGDWRDKPGEKPKAHQKALSLSRDGAATAVASGSATDNDCTMSWEPKTFQLKPWADLGASSSYTVMITAVVDEADQGHLWFELMGVADPCFKRQVQGGTSSMCEALSENGNCSIFNGPNLVSSAAVHPFNDILSGRLKQPATLGATGAIGKGQLGPVDASTCCGGEFNIPWTYQERISWDAMSPEGGTAPDPANDER